MSHAPRVNWAALLGLSVVLSLCFVLGFALFGPCVLDCFWGAEWLVTGRAGVGVGGCLLQWRLARAP